MLNERAIVESLNRQQLLDLVTHFDLSVSDRRVRDNLVKALTGSRKARLDLILAQLPVAALKALCREHDLEETGRGKAQFVERLCAAAAPARRAKAAVSQRGSAGKVAPANKKAAAAAKAPASKKAAAAAKAPASKAAAAASTKKAAATQAAASTRKAAATKAARGTKKTAAGRTPASEPPAAAAKAPANKKAAAPTKNSAPQKSPAADRPRGGDGAGQAPQAQAPGGEAAAAPAERPAAAPGLDKAVAVAAPAQAAAFAAAQAAVAKPQAAAVQHASVASSEASDPRNPLNNVVALRTATANLQRSGPGAYRPPLPVDANLFGPTSAVKKCQACKAKIELRKCGVQRCHTLIQANPSRKICAECLFERNTLSMTEFNERLVEESKCPQCGQAWQRAS